MQILKQYQSDHMMNIKQQNIVSEAIRHAEFQNNFLDCDVVQEAMTKCQEAIDAENLDDAIYALDYLYAALKYRNTGFIPVGFALKDLKESATPVSLLEAVGRNDGSSDEWAKKAQSGQVMRIM